MTINFDVISDLYLDSLHDFTWEGKATSLFCIVAGNISSDHDLLFEFLEELGEHYEAVFFIDGDLEHDLSDGDFDRSYSNIRDNLEDMEKVVFLHENIIILPGVTLLATNGWTTFDFTSAQTVDETLEYLEDREMVPMDLGNKIFKMAVTDQVYMYNSIENCQTMPDVNNIVIITNSVPVSDFVSHDDHYDGTILGDTVGNSGIIECLDNDITKKVSTWIFGKYPGDLDYNIDGVRFINNPGVNKDLSIYYPKILKF